MFSTMTSVLGVLCVCILPVVEHFGHVFYFKELYKFKWFGKMTIKLLNLIELVSSATIECHAFPHNTTLIYDWVSLVKKKTKQAKL